jgi:argininosuccinate lyase
VYGKGDANWQNAAMFSPEYVRLVLNENFTDAKTLFLAPFMAVQRAHLVMLAGCGLLGRDEARALRDALAAIDPASVERTAYSTDFEDLFFHLEQRLAASAGEDLAGRLHLARSRNDIDMTIYRMRLREWLLDVAEAVVLLRRAFVDVAAAHTGTLFPAHTHTQPAQPTTLAHYLLAAVEQFERDTQRLLAGYARTNRNPLGACAITGTGFPIDRQRTSDLLGFAEPTGNTYGSIAAADHLLEAVAAAAIAAAGAGRVVQDLLLWCTHEVGYLRLPDGLVQSSSLMPQKRNPVALEHARVLASKAAGQAAAVATAVHNTPFGDIVDTEDDLQPLVAAVFTDATRALTLVAVAVRSATFDVARMRARAGEGWVTLTELADTLVRDHGLSFRIAHRIAARAAAGPSSRVEDLVESIARASREFDGREIRMMPEALSRALSPEHFVAIRDTPGGPSAAQTASALAAARTHLASDAATLAGARHRLAAAATALDDAVRAL